MDPMTTEDAIRFLSEAPVAHLGLVSDGKPYITPMSFVFDGDRILFRTQPGRKLQAIEKSPRCASKRAPSTRSRAIGGA